MALAIMSKYRKNKTNNKHGKDPDLKSSDSEIIMFENIVVCAKYVICLHYPDARKTGSFY